MLGAAALAGGIALSVATGVGRRFTGIAGWVAALCTTAVVSVVISLLDARGVGLPRELSILAGLAVLGMDWRYVSRLRGAVVLSGLFVVPLAGTRSPWAVAGGLLWLGGALATFWVLERDARAAVPRATDPSGGRGPDEDPRPVDLLSVLVPALLIGVAAALVLGNPSCASKTSKGSSGATAANGSPSGRGQTGASGNAGGASLDPSTGADASASSLGAASVPLYRLDQAGHEQSLDVDRLGAGVIRAGSGPSYSVESHDGRTIVRNGDGTVVDEIDGGTVTAHGADGSANQEYQLDDAGHLTVEGTSGQRYQLDESGDALVLRGPNGEVVASGPLDADRLDVRGPDGRALVAGADEAGTIAVPNQATRENLLGQGKTYTTDGSGNPVVAEPDGATHTYGTDSQGRPQVQVTGQGPARTYVYDESGDTLRVVEFDAQGRFVRDLVVGTPGPSALRATAKPAPGSAGDVQRAHAGRGRSELGAHRRRGTGRGPVGRRGGVVAREPEGARPALVGRDHGRSPRPRGIPSGPATSARRDRGELQRGTGRGPVARPPAGPCRAGRVRRPVRARGAAAGHPGLGRGHRGRGDGRPPRAPQQRPVPAPVPPGRGTGLISGLRRPAR